MIRSLARPTRNCPKAGAVAVIFAAAVFAGCAGDRPSTESRPPETGEAAAAPQSSSRGVRTLSPANAIRPNGPWNVGTRAGDLIFVAGMRGIDPKTNQPVHDDEARVRQAFLNMKQIAESEGATLKDATRIVVYVTNMARIRPLVNKVEAELWGHGPFPPRTIVEVRRLNQDDIIEVEGTFYAPASSR